MTLPTPEEKPPPSGGNWKLAAFIILALTILGSVPTIIRAYHVLNMNVSWAEAPFALHQHALWQRNWMCASAPGEEARLAASKGNQSTAGQQLETFFGLTVRVQGCANGDVLVRTVGADGTGRALWVAADGYELDQESAALAALTSAQASGEATPFAVMCQAWAGNEPNRGKVVRVISRKGTCIREMINIYRGEVLRTETVPCDAECVPAE